MIANAYALKRATTEEAKNLCLAMLMMLGVGFVFGLTPAILSLKRSFFAELILPFNLYGVGIVMIIQSRTNIIEPDNEMMRGYRVHFFLPTYILLTLFLPVTWRNGIVLRYPFGVGVAIYNIVQREIWGDPIIFETDLIGSLCMITLIEVVVYINLKS